jgi:hypothetical protein
MSMEGKTRQNSGMSFYELSTFAKPIPVLLSVFIDTPSVPKLVKLSGEKREFSPAKTSFNRQRYT